jgi:hypothetical protein
MRSYRNATQVGFMQLMQLMQVSSLLTLFYAFNGPP